MGADYIWAYYEIGNEPLETLDLDAATAELAAAVVAASDADVIDAYSAATQGLEATAGEAREAFNAAIGVLAGEYRDSAIDTIGGVTIFHSGGPSWGDSPTEAFDQIALLWAAKQLGGAADSDAPEPSGQR